MGHEVSDACLDAMLKCDSQNVDTGLRAVLRSTLRGGSKKKQAAFRVESHCEFCLIHVGIYVGHMSWERPNPDLVTLLSICEVYHLAEEASAGLQSSPLLH